MSRVGRFWVTVVLVVLVFAVASALLLPYEALQLRTEAERWQAWLLTLWTGGVMSILFGLSGLLGFLSPVGVREVVEAGSVAKAMETLKSVRQLAGGDFHGNFAWWLVSTGAVLIAVYFVSWWILDV